MTRIKSNKISRRFCFYKINPANLPVAIQDTLRNESARLIQKNWRSYIHKH